MVKKILLRVLLVLGLVIAVLAGNLVVFNITASRISEGTTGSVSAMKAHKEQSEMLISRVNNISEEMHSRDQLIIYVRTEVVNPLINILNNTMARRTEGAELDRRLVMQPGEVVVKRRNDPFMGTDLDQILTDHQVAKLVVVGLDAAHCVKSTVLAAHNRGYNISVIEEAVISDKEELKAEAMQEFRNLGVEILSID